MLTTRLRGARTHNLGSVDLDLEPGQLVAITGVSGSGKSSLAMDTLYAEGQRRFVESFSPYARLFLERLERPPMDGLEPVPAAVAVDRRAPVKSSRSTVATMADIEPYLSALFTRLAVPLCPEHGQPGALLDAVGAADRIIERFEGRRIAVSRRSWVDALEDYLDLRQQLLRDGLRRVWVADAVADIEQVRPSIPVEAGRVDVVLDRVRVARRERGRLAAAVEAAWELAAGVVHVRPLDHGGRDGDGEEPMLIRRGLACPTCSTELSPPRPGVFSYESPLGACQQCRGFGRVIGIDYDKVIPDPGKSLAKGALRPWTGKSTAWERRELRKLCDRNAVPLDQPWGELDREQRRIVLEGDGPWGKRSFPGIRGWFEWLETKTYKMHVRVFLARYRAYDPCPACQGRRLNEHALSYRVDGVSIADWHAMEISEALRRLRRLEGTARGPGGLRRRSEHSAGWGQGEIARRELLSRLGYLERVGLGYLTLDRQARTLSAGEAQRVTLTAALGTSLHNALFVLDEPTIGLHPSDVRALAEVVVELARRNNAVLLVEHDPTLIGASDRVVELGPGAGVGGGTVVADGTVAEVVATGGATARALGAQLTRSSAPRPASGWLRVRGARAHNLRDVDVDLPLGVVCAVTGPSGSGKTSLTVNIVQRALARRLGDFDQERPGEHDSLEVEGFVRRVTLVDQSPLGRTSRGNTATYTKAWDTVRKLLAAEPRAAAAGLGPSAFSFNVDAGRCTACAGEGFETVEMQFLADVRLVCPVCKGRRFGQDVLAVRHRGKTVAELLDSTVDELLELFVDQPSIRRALGPVQRLGLGYVRVGQPLSTLSGGEAQRLKLARALADDHRGALLLLDEPSAGLHADEVAKVLGALRLIVDSGGSAIVVEHDLDLVAAADWVVDLGPGAGSHGGSVVATGAPEALAETDTRTGLALREHLALRQKAPARARTRHEPRSKGRARGAAARAELRVEGAREHNLVELSVAIPHGALSVVTGPSGSGKSTLAFDVIFAEGQRRFLETLTPYARQFLPTMPRPAVDRVAGVPPSIALEQRTARAGARSTVATVTEVAHYLRLAYAKLGTAYCPDHGLPIESQTPDEVFAVLARRRGRVDLLAPVVQARKGTYLDVFAAAARAGIERAWCDGELVSTDDPPRLAKTREHTILLLMAEAIEPRKLDRGALDAALRWGNGSIELWERGGARKRLSTRGGCPTCGLAIADLDPRYFSFNTAQGRCPRCEGEGVVQPAPPRRRGRAAKRGRRAAREAGAQATAPCPECQGARLGPVPREVRLAGERYHELGSRSVLDALARVGRWRFGAGREPVAEPIVAELGRRLRFLCDVGLDYLSLDRAARTLSGGEMQRLRLAAQLGAGLTGALYVLDEPTIGLHPRDTSRLLGNLRSLVEMGSTVLVVEHDAETILAADHLVDMGPGGGSRGGRIMAQGSPAEVLDSEHSPTARALGAPPLLRERLPVPRQHPRLELCGVREHNLRGVDLSIPIERFTVVAGVSGSGKSTLVRGVLLPALRAALGLVAEPAGAHDVLRGHDALVRAVAVDQSPIGRTPRSVPATFLGIWAQLRALFAATPEAQVRGFGPARFSFNAAAGGRCATCEGQGVISHEMSFLPDVVTICPACDGQRFEPRTLEVRYHGMSVGEVLGLTAEQAAERFAHHPKIAAPLSTLVDLGAGYITLGQGSHTLSGGEAQRLKLAVELTATARHSATLYVLDEPTTGLHLADVDRLMTVLGRLVHRGDTLVVIEHHPSVIAGADWVVELGPEGGARGGRVVAQGDPRKLARRRTATGAVLSGLFADVDARAG